MQWQNLHKAKLVHPTKSLGVSRIEWKDTNLDGWYFHDSENHSAVYGPFLTETEARASFQKEVEAKKLLDSILS